jgi:hypothetical protein
MDQENVTPQTQTGGAAVEAAEDLLDESCLTLEVLNAGGCELVLPLGAIDSYDEYNSTDPNEAAEIVFRAMLPLYLRNVRAKRAAESRDG